MKKILLVLTIAGSLILGKSAFDPGQAEQEVLTQPVPLQVQEQSQPTQAPVIEVGEPARFAIPKLGVETVVEEVGLTETQRMGVPQGVNNVGWYKFGAKPGEKGQAVIAGHLDGPDGSPAVFYGLTSLRSGDEIVVTDSEGKEWEFVVEETATYTDANFPIETVFGPSDEVRLNLITCEGTFDRQARNYSDRFVVFAVLGS